MGTSERSKILKEADQLTHTDRAAIYGDPLIGMRCAAELKALYRHYAAGRYSPEHDEAIELHLVKLARIATGAFHRDNYVDGAAYVAMAAELETRAPTESITAFLFSSDALTPAQRSELKKQWNRENRAHDYLELNTSESSAAEKKGLGNPANEARHPDGTQKTEAGK